MASYRRVAVGMLAWLLVHCRKYDGLPGRPSLSLWQEVISQESHRESLSDCFSESSSERSSQPIIKGEQSSTGGAERFDRRRDVRPHGLRLFECRRYRSSIVIWRERIYIYDVTTPGISGSLDPRPCMIA